MKDRSAIHISCCFFVVFFGLAASLPGQRGFWRAGHYRSEIRSFTIHLNLRPGKRCAWDVGIVLRRPRCTIGD